MQLFISKKRKYVSVYTTTRQTQSKHDAHTPVKEMDEGGQGESGKRGDATDRGTYVELVYELLQDTWSNILQQTISQFKGRATGGQQPEHAVSCTVAQISEIVNYI